MELLPLSEVTVGLFGVALIIGLIGCLVPLLPGQSLQLATFTLWASLNPSRSAWLGLALAVFLFIFGMILKYLLPGRQLKAQGIPNSTLWWGAGGSLLGFFLIPVLGLPLGFAAGVYGAEYRRLGTGDAARAATIKALLAAGWSTLIEVTTGLAIALTWLIAVLQTS